MPIGKKGFQKGQSGNIKGRAPGTLNKLTRTVKETVLNVFNDLQNDPETDLKAFAKKYPKDFYQIASKLIPTEISGNISINEITIDIPDQE